MKQLYILFLILLGITSILYSGERGILTVEFLNVGNGSSILIITPSKYTVLIDGGGIEKYNIIKKYLEEYNIKRIDEIILSNPKPEHTGGLIPLLKNYDVGDIIDSGMPFSNPIYENFLETIMKLQDKSSISENIDASISDVLQDKHHYEYYNKKAGDILNWGPDVEVTVLNPPKLYKNTESDENNNSLAIKLTYGRIKYLFTGDISITAEKYLCSQGYKIKADILNVPNHGNSISGYKNFINLVSPKISIISVGKDNPYGNPDKKVLLKYKNAGSRIYRTDLNGSIKIISDGVKYSVVPEIEQPESKILATIYKIKERFGNQIHLKKIKKKTININTATVSELLKLPGLSIFKAQMIIRYRNKHGKLKKIEDLTKIPGINTAIVNKIKDKILFN